MDQLVSLSLVGRTLAAVRVSIVALSLLAAGILASSHSARAATLDQSLRFVPSTSAGVTGYVVRVGARAGVMNDPTAVAVDIGSNFALANGVGSLPLSRVISGSAYLVMQAYDGLGLYSLPSNELFVAIDPPAGSCSRDADCADGDACDGTERCVSGACVAGTPLSCAVSDPCLAAYCSAASGCGTSPLADGTSCNDGNATTVGDVCRSGVCVGDVAAPPGPLPVPEPGTVLLLEDFESLAPGLQAPGWVVSDDAGTLYAWKLVALADEAGGLGYGFPTALDRRYFAHYASPGSDAWGSYEYAGRLRIDDPAGGIGATIVSSRPDGDEHVALVRDGAHPSFQLELSLADAPVYCSTTRDTGHVPEVGVWTVFRLRAVSEADGLRVQAKAWHQRDAEPSGWTVDCLVEGGEAVAGRAGVVVYGAGAKRVDDLAAWVVDQSDEGSEVTPPLFADDFEHDERGGDPFGWVDAVGSSIRSGAGELFRVVLRPPGTQVLAVSDEASDASSHVEVPGSDGWRDYEVTGRMMAPVLGATQGVLVYSHAHEGGPAIALVGNRPSGVFRIALLNASIGTCTGDPWTGVPGAAGVWQRFRLRALTIGSSVRVLARVWPETTLEPTVWQADCTTTPGRSATSGRVGVWSNGPGYKLWDDIEVREVGAP